MILHVKHCTAIFILLLTVVAFAQDEPAYVPGEALLKTAYTLTAGKVDGKVVTGITWFDQLSQKYSISGLTKIFNSNQARFANYYKIVFTPETDVMAICADFSSQPDVVYAEPNGIYYAAGLPEPTDPLYIKQWALTKIQAPQAWEITTGNATVVVGVLDSGTDIGWPHLPSPHPDLETNLWNENGMYGYNVIDPGRQPYDNLGHGTHCAGVIGAVNNNATGVCGIAGGWGATPGVKVMTVKCLDSTGGTEEAILAEAVRWAADPDDNPATQDGARILGSVKSFV